MNFTRDSPIKSYTCLWTYIFACVCVYVDVWYVLYNVWSKYNVFLVAVCPYTRHILFMCSLYSIMYFTR